jgi:fumarylpyruvate hydrolase
MSDIPPFYFQKSADMIVENHSTVSYPGLTQDYQHEIELVVALARGVLALDHARRLARRCAPPRRAA